MFNRRPPLSAHTDPAEIDLLGELEKNSAAEFRQRRAYFRVVVKARVMVQPGNASQRGELRAQCITGDVSEGGCRVLSPVPLNVGDVYYLEFDRKSINIAPLYARCMRCAVLREDAFEAGFGFFCSIALPEGLEALADAQLHVK